VEVVRVELRFHYREYPCAPREAGEIIELGGGGGELRGNKIFSETKIFIYDFDILFARNARNFNAS